MGIVEKSTRPKAWIVNLMDHDKTGGFNIRLRDSIAALDAVSLIESANFRFDGVLFTFPGDYEICDYPMLWGGGLIVRLGRVVHISQYGGVLESEEFGRLSLENNAHPHFLNIAMSQSDRVFFKQNQRRHTAISEYVLAHVKDHHRDGLAYKEFENTVYSVDDAHPGKVRVHYREKKAPPPECTEGRPSKLLSVGWLTYTPQLIFDRPNYPQIAFLNIASCTGINTAILTHIINSRYRDLFQSLVIHKNRRFIMFEFDSDVPVNDRGLSPVDMTFCDKLYCKIVLDVELPFEQTGVRGK